MIGLSIETSCDETSVCILEDDRNVLSNIVLSQIDIHEEYGGVVPEIASRHHIKAISNIVDLALEKANKTFNNLDYISVTYGPGLIGALLVGVSYAKSLAYALNIPLVPVNHIEGHIASCYLTNKDLKPPFIALVVSGGHSHIVLVEDYTKFKVIAKTRDDAVGEAFDKVARVLGLGYPGGPKLSKLAESGTNTYKLPKTMFVDSLDFSFSGVKTHVLNTVNNDKNLNKANLACSFEINVAEVLVEHTMIAMERYNMNKVVLAGGVSANKYLRKHLQEKCLENNYNCFLPDLKYTTDNAAMIAVAGYYNYVENKEEYNILNNLDLNAKANINIGGN